MWTGADVVHRDILGQHGFPCPGQRRQGEGGLALSSFFCWGASGAVLARAGALEGGGGAGGCLPVYVFAYYVAYLCVTCAREYVHTPLNLYCLVRVSF